MKKTILLLSVIFFPINSFAQETTQPNIILMIGDGLGLTQITRKINCHSIRSHENID